MLVFHPVRLTGSNGADDWFEITVLFSPTVVSPYKVIAGFSEFARKNGREDFPDMIFRDDAEARNYIRWCLDTVSAKGYKFISRPMTKKGKEIVESMFMEDLTVCQDALVNKRKVVI